MEYYKNINGTSNKRFKIKSGALESYRKYIEKSLTFQCSRFKCKNAAKVGAHIQKSRISDCRWYIVPLCNKCNKLCGEFPVCKNEAVLVSNLRKMK